MKTFFKLLLVSIFFSPIVGLATPLRVIAPTTLEGSGIISALVQDFNQVHPEIEVIVNSTGALNVLEMASRGEADLIFSHFPKGEGIFYIKGLASHSAEIMYNHFAILAPIDHGLDLYDVDTLEKLLKLLAKESVDFITPHNRAGTTHRLKDLMAYSGIDNEWDGFYSSGTTAIKTLLLAEQNEHFTFADMGTYLVNKNKMAGAIIPLFRDDVALQNRVSAIVVNEEQFPNMNSRDAILFWNYLIGHRAQLLIKGFTGESINTEIFTPIAHLDPNVISVKLEKQNSQSQQKYLLLLSISLMMVLLIIAITFFYWKSKQVNKTRQKIEKRFLTAMDVSQNGIWDWNLITGDCYISQQCKTIFGIDKDSKVQFFNPKQWLFDHISEGYREAIWNSIQQHIDQSNTAPFSHEVLQVISGKETRLSIQGRVILNEEYIPVNVIGAVTDITKNHLQGKQLQHFTHIALHDALTGLPNRLLLTQRLDHEIAISDREATPLTLLLLDLNGFKAVNDNLGHHAGDEILIKVGEQLRQVIKRKTDLISRLGGDEFVILLPNKNTEEATKVANEVTLAIRSIEVEAHNNLVDVSIGIAEYPLEANTATELLKKADSAMYEAKP